MTTPFWLRLSLPSKRSTAWLLLLALAVISGVSAAALEAEAAGGDNDLDLLLRLLSQDIRVGTIEYARPIDPLWIKDVRQLQSSRIAAVAKTANAVQETVKLREEALKILDKVKAENDKFADDNPVNLEDAVNGLLPEDFDIDDALANRRITPAEADAYRKRRNRQEGAASQLVGNFLRRYVTSYLADEKVLRMRYKAEALEAKALAENLIPALRARAGAKRDDLPLRIIAGFAPNQHGGFSPNQHGSRMLTTMISSSDEVLTRLTLLMDIRTSYGRRRAVAFIPWLEPGRGVQVAPIPVAVPADVDPADDLPEGGIRVVRHSVWCDQFTYQGEDVPLDSGLFARVAYCALVGEQGRGYAFDNLSFDRRRDRTSYTVEFTELKPAKETFSVKGKVIFYESDDREKPTKVTTFSAAFHGVAAAREVRSNGRDRAAAAATAAKRASMIVPDAQLSIGSGKTKSDIDFFIMESGRVEWMPRTGPLQNRTVRTAEEGRQAIEAKAQLQKHNRVLAQARLKARAGQKKEAVESLKEYIASNPNYQWINDAKRLLKELE